MAWQAVHPSTTEWTRIPDEGEAFAEFEIGFWPPLISERFSAYGEKLRKVRKEAPEVDPFEDPEAFMRELGMKRAIAIEAVKWGVRNWRGIIGEDGKPVEASTIEESVDGRAHTVLDKDSIEFLHYQKLLIPLYLKVWLYNVMTLEQKKTFGSPLPSPTSTSPIDAASVTQEADTVMEN